MRKKIITMVTVGLMLLSSLSFSACEGADYEKLADQVLEELNQVQNVEQPTTVSDVESSINIEASAEMTTFEKYDDTEMYTTQELQENTTQESKWEEEATTEENAMDTSHPTDSAIEEETTSKDSQMEEITMDIVATEKLTVDSTELEETSENQEFVEETTSKEEEMIAVTGVFIDKSTVTLKEGECDKIIITVLPQDATNKYVLLNSTNTHVATIDAYGKITANEVGTATISVITKDGYFVADCEVTVTSAEILPTKVSLNKTNVNLNKGNTTTLTATVSPSNATNKSVIWTSSDASVASVTSNGKVTAKGNGTATITARVGDRTATCKITVTTSVSDVTLNKTSITLDKGKSTTLTATVKPSDASNKAVTWSSSNTSVATVNNSGKISAIGKGTAVITVKSKDTGKTATCKVTVNVPVTGVSISGAADVALDFNNVKNKYYQCSVSVVPSDASNKSVTFKSSDTSVATVSSTGKITALKRGTATITVTTADGGYTDKIIVYVYKSDASIPEGGNVWYKIRSAVNYNYMIDVTNGSTYNGAKLKLRSDSTAHSPYFQFHDYVSKYGGICVVPKANSGSFVMDANRGSSYSEPLKTGNLIDLWDLTAGDYDACTFEIVRLWDNTVIIKLADFDLAVGVNSVSEGAQLGLKKFNVFDSKQRWSLQGVDLSSETASPGIETAISWAQAQMNAGNTSYSYWCLKFIGDAFRQGGINNAGYSTATQAGNSLITSTSTNPPRGAVVFWDWYGTINGVYANYGHVGISLGNGKVIHADYNGIKITGLSLSGRTYRGWGTWK